jgi:hypothetical protein
MLHRLALNALVTCRFDYHFAPLRFDIIAEKPGARLLV